jgi:MFS family permease
VPQASFRELCSQRNFWLLVFTIGFASAVQTAVISNLSLFAIDIGSAKEHGAYLISVLSIMGMISSPLVGRFCDIWSIKFVATTMFLLSALASLLFIGANTYLLILLAAFVQGFAGGSIIPLWASLVGRLYDTRIYGQVMGATTLGVFAMTALAPLVAGWIHDVTNSYRLLFIIMCTLMVATAAVVLLIRIPAVPHKSLADA